MSCFFVSFPPASRSRACLLQPIACPGEPNQVCSPITARSGSDTRVMPLCRPLPVRRLTPGWYSSHKARRPPNLAQVSTSLTPRHGSHFPSEAGGALLEARTPFPLTCRLFASRSVVRLYSFLTHGGVDHTPDIGNGIIIGSNLGWQPSFTTLFIHRFFPRANSAHSSYTAVLHSYTMDTKSRNRLSILRKLLYLVLYL